MLHAPEKTQLFHNMMITTTATGKVTYFIPYTATQSIKPIVLTGKVTCFIPYTATQSIKPIVHTGKVTYFIPYTTTQLH